MGNEIGFLSQNRKMIEEFIINLQDYNIKIFRGIDATRNEDFEILVVDSDYFDDNDSVQFYLSKIRKKFKNIPVFLILKEDSLERINHEWFFNDFLVYPFKKNELRARIKRILWERNLVDDKNIILAGKIKINLQEYVVLVDNQKMDLTYKEFELLRFLVQNKGTVFSRKELLSKIWGVDYIGGTRTVDVHIRRLRGKLGDDFNTIIETVRNVGYRCFPIDD